MAHSPTHTLQDKTPDTTPRAQTDAKASASSESLLSESVVSCALVDTPSRNLSDADTFIVELNQAIKPPKPLSVEDVHIRAMLLVSDARNQHGGRFPLEELERVAALVIDAPVLVGHRKDRLPIARVFKAELVERNGERWVKAYLYWLRETVGAETLRANIDGGVYKDCSLGFTFEHAECSVCQDDIRTCGHISQPTTAIENNDEAPCYYYRNVQQALEISLVYRGANPGARIGATLKQPSISTVTSPPLVIEPDWLTELHVERIAEVTDSGFGPDTPKDHPAPKAPCSSSSLTLTYPLLEGLPLLVGRHNGNTLVLLDDGSPAPKRLATIVSAICQFDSDETDDGDFLFYSRIVGMRGKSKRSSRDLLRFLIDDSGPVRSLKLRTLALLRFQEQWLSADNYVDFQDALRGLCSSKRALCAVQTLRTPKSGVEQSDTETLSLDNVGRFRVTRRRRKPLIHAQLSDRNTLSIPLLFERASDSDNEQLTVTLDTKQPIGKGASKSDIVALAFDRIAYNGATCKLINPRIVNHLGEYHSGETLLNIGNMKSSADTTLATMALHPTIRLSVGRIAFSASGDIRKQSPPLAAGAPVIVQSSSGASGRARVIHLLDRSRIIVGALADDRSPQEALT